MLRAWSRCIHEIFFSAGGDSIKITFAPYFFLAVGLDANDFNFKMNRVGKAINVSSVECVFTTMAIIKQHTENGQGFVNFYWDCHICGWSECNPSFGLLNNHHHHLCHNHNLKNHFSVRSSLQYTVLMCVLRKKKLLSAHDSTPSTSVSPLDFDFGTSFSLV